MMLSRAAKLTARVRGKAGKLVAELTVHKTAYERILADVFRL